MQTRERLIDVAAKLVDEGGPASVTLREVGHRAGVSHNAPYKHFLDKRDLLGSVAARELNSLAERINAAVAGQPDGRAQVVASALAYLRWAREHPARFKLVFGPWGAAQHPELGTAAEKATQAMYAAVKAAVHDGTLQGDADLVAALVWALGHGAIDLDLSGHLRKKPGSPEPEALVEYLISRLTTSP